MAKVEGKDSETLRDLANLGLAGELESRLRDLERNIAVAKEFIKLADESYSQVRHEWSLLQRDLGNRSPQTGIANLGAFLTPKPVEQTFPKRVKGSRRKSKTGIEGESPKETHSLTKIDGDLHRTTVEVPSKKETDTANDDDTPNPHRPLKRLRPRAKG